MVPKTNLTQQEQAFLDALNDDANKGDIRVCMHKAGYAPTSSSGKVINALTDEIVAIARNKLAESSVKASLSLSGILTTPDAMGARNAINAATQILDRVGIVKKEEIVIEDKRASIVLLPPVDEN